MAAASHTINSRLTPKRGVQGESGGAGGVAKIAMSSVMVRFSAARLCPSGVNLWLDSAQIYSAILQQCQAMTFCLGINLLMWAH